MSSLINAQDASKIQREIEMLFRQELDKENVHNAFLKVYSPSMQINWDFAGGKFEDGEPVSAENPFYAASIGKTFTATAIVILKEQGKLNFGDKISKYLSANILENLHVFDGKDYSFEITIAQLLQHTSGLPDYFEGETVDGSLNMIRLIFTDTAKFWQPSEIIEFTKEKMTPNFPPGEGYQYTDTGFVLLGLIVEKLSKMSLEDFFLKHFFKPLNMKSTWMNLRSEPIEKTARTAEFFVGDFGASTMTSLSADWAGGGLFTTAADLNKFQSALFSGKIISKSSLKAMQNWLPETVGMYYGFGLRKIVFKELSHNLPDLYVAGHSGSTASIMYYCPELDVYLAGTLDQTDATKDSLLFLAGVLEFLNSVHP
jgi:D-alanyl-D-alanine carboxypeptidase